MCDGILKLAQAIGAGLPIEPLLPMVPGLTQQMVDEIKKKAQATSVTNLINSLRPAAQAATQDQQVNHLSSQTTSPTAAVPAPAATGMAVRPMTMPL
jgi:hypothetical protein